jgi:hypothetical protein
LKKVVENSGIKAVQNHKSLFDKAELVINCGDAGQERIDRLGHE